MSLALGQPEGCTGASLGCSRARDIFGSLKPSPKRLLAPSLIDFWGSPGIRALYQAIGIPKIATGTRRTPQIGICPLRFVPLSTALFSADCKRGRRERGHEKKRQKSSKSVEKFFDTFRQIFAQGKKRQKSSKSVKNIFDTFSTIFAHPLFSGPFCNPLIFSKS